MKKRDRQQQIWRHRRNTLQTQNKALKKQQQQNNNNNNKRNRKKRRVIDASEHTLMSRMQILSSSSMFR